MDTNREGLRQPQQLDLELEKVNQYLEKHPTGSVGHTALAHLLIEIETRHRLDRIRYQIHHKVLIASDGSERKIGRDVLDGLREDKVRLDSEDVLVNQRIKEGELLLPGYIAARKEATCMLGKVHQGVNSNPNYAFAKLEGMPELESTTSGVPFRMAIRDRDPLFLHTLLVKDLVIKELAKPISSPPPPTLSIS